MMCAPNQVFLHDEPLRALKSEHGTGISGIVFYVSGPRKFHDFATAAKIRENAADVDIRKNHAESRNDAGA